MAAWISGLQVNVIYNLFSLLSVRLYLVYSLTFFVLLISNSCSQKQESVTATIIWKDKKAIAVSLSKSVSASPDAISVHLQSDAKNEIGAPILGETAIQNDSIFFTPLIPFTRGLQYRVFANDKSVASFSIPKPDASEAPEIVAIYPTQDTLPENLLKIYLQFSQPMQEGKSADYVALLKSNADTVKGAFLDLQPELWNENRTQLTLWLDPGRIKRDLQPNKKLGAPMQKNQGYRIVIADKWKDAQGSALIKTYSKSFVTAIRDSLSPAPGSWKMSALHAETISALQIDFTESLDHGLLSEAFEITNEKGLSIPGKWQFVDEETQALFVPNEKWISGNYHLKIDTRLEDLASNNVNRPFDRDITKNENPKNPQAFVKIDFKIR